MHCIVFQWQAGLINMYSIACTTLPSLFPRLTMQATVISREDMQSYAWNLL